MTHLAGILGIEYRMQARSIDTRETYHLIDEKNFLPVNLIEGLFFSGKPTAAHIGTVIFHCGDDLLSEGCIRLDVFWRPAVGNSEQIVDHENLTITTATGPDANGGNCNLAAYFRCRFRWDTFEDNGKRSGSFYSLHIEE